MKRFKETQADLDIKEKLWGATLVQIMELANRCAESHVVGEAYSEAQRDVTYAGKAMGYPITLTRTLAAAIRQGKLDVISDIADRYRAKIGL